jgi:hypothetical protein
MKKLIAACLLGLAGLHGAQADEALPDMLIAIGANEYTHDVRLGVLPFYVVWANRGRPLEKAAATAFHQRFQPIGLCDANENADAVLALSSHINFNPMVATYYATVDARLFSSDGKLVGRYHATGEDRGPIGARLVDDHVQRAYDNALQSIATQFAADAAAQKGIDRSLPKSPCGLMLLLPAQ